MYNISVLDKVKSPGIISVDCGIGRFQHELVSPNESCVLDLASPLYAPSSRTKIYDRSGNGNHGTITGALWKRNNFGVWVLSYDAVNDYVNCGSGASLANLGPVTIEAWIYPKSIGEGSFGQIYNKRSVANHVAGTNFALYATTKLRFLVEYDTTNLEHRTADGAIALNTWQKVAVSWDGSTAAANAPIYKNGVEVASYSIATNAVGTREDDAAYNLLLGNSDALSLTFDGSMIFHRVGNRVLSAEEHLDSFNQERHLFGV